jgi:hypothetical protein
MRQDIDPGDLRSERVMGELRNAVGSRLHHKEIHSVAFLKWPGRLQAVKCAQTVIYEPVY